MRRADWLMGTMLLLAACNKDSGEGAAPAKSDAPAVAGTGAAVVAALSANAAAPPAKPVLANGRSPVPTLDEWNTQRKEVTVKGSSALNCETKAVREYLRVSCRGRNDTGGTPTTVRVRRGGGGEALTFAGGGITSLVVPFVEGIALEAEFSWTDKSHKFTSTWPRGSKQPVMYGVFDGAKSPLDGTAEGDQRKLCECHKKTFNAATCDDMMGGADADCDRTYGNDCSMLLACARGEPAAFPRCLPGSVNFGAMGRCAPQCGPGRPPCAAGKICTPDMASSPVCLDP